MIEIWSCCICVSHGGKAFIFECLGNSVDLVILFSTHRSFGIERTIVGFFMETRSTRWCTLFLPGLPEIEYALNWSGVCALYKSQHNVLRSSGKWPWLNGDKSYDGQRICIKGLVHAGRFILMIWVVCTSSFLQGLLSCSNLCFYVFIS